MNEYLQFLRDIKSVTFSTVDGDIPCVRIIDVMLHENNALYFLTARGKPFFNQLKKNPKIAIIGMNRKYKTVRVSGECEAVERIYVDKIFEANPMMNDLYQNEKRDILDAFCLKNGEGEMFDLGVNPIHRERFTFGNIKTKYTGYHITTDCIECGICKRECIGSCISKGSPYKINSKACLECGRCVTYCPTNAIKNPFTK
jgi:uncharacterized pyridoxamine 5'-phosphate oxidase family protein/Pyruvate/2-oxoacid:ferredoxin oxidoreductase delta subunit